MFIDIQVKKPAEVERLTNQLKTLPAPLDTFMKERREKVQQNKTATIGRPFFVQRVKMRGA